LSGQMRNTTTMKSKRKPSSDDTAKELERILKEAKEGHYVLKLYVTGTSPRSTQAIANIHQLCEEYLAGRYDLEIIDIYQQPGEAAEQQIIAAPTLVKSQPSPPKRMIGDLSDRDKVLVGLNLAGGGISAGTKPKTKWVKL
jgi:circadian clock protein KaiB